MGALEPFVTILLGFVIGLLVGLTGVGGAALITPSLVIFLGMNPVVAVATGLVYLIPTKIVAAAQHLRQKNVEPKLALVMGLAAVPTAVIGAHLVSVLHRNEATRALTSHYLALGLGVLLIAISVSLLWDICPILARNRKKSQDEESSSNSTLELWLAVPVGAIVGFVVGMTSVGGGCLIVTALIFIYRLPIRKIVGTNILVAAILVIAGGVTHFVEGNADILTTGLLLVGAIPGVILGCRAVMRAPATFLKILVTLAILASGVTLVAKNLKAPAPEDDLVPPETIQAVSLYLPPSPPPRTS